MNTFGQYLRLTTFGESHGKAIGGILDGVPAGLKLDFDVIREAVRRRAPSSAIGSTARKEADEPEFLSGIYEGVTLGTPLAFIIRNTDVKPQDYEQQGGALRPNHADYTYGVKYGIRDPRGGGRASARETAVRVVAGAIASQILALKGIDVVAWTDSIGTVKCQNWEGIVPTQEQIYSNDVRCPDVEIANGMQNAIKTAAENCDSLGGCVRCVLSGVPAGLGEPIFGKLQARLAAAMMSIPAVKGFEYGDGFAAAESCGSQQVDIFVPTSNGIGLSSNHSGGIQGGISNGQPITMRVAIKPIATMPGREFPTTDAAGNPCTIQMRGRHDICAVPRAVPVVQAMAALVVADALLAPTSTIK